MKPDAYMPFYGNDYFSAVELHDDRLGMTYLRVLWYYWSVNHCEGLPDDDRMLRKLCRFHDSANGEWEDAKAVLFDNQNFFCLGEDGLWHQKRADHEWTKAKENYDLKLARALAGAKARWKPKHGLRNARSNA